MNNRLRTVYLILFSGFAVLGGLMILLLALAELKGGAEDTAEAVLGWCIAGAMVTAIVREFVAEHFRIEFRRYLLRVMALTARRGLSLGHAFMALAQDFDGPRKAVVYRILTILDEGKPLSAALAGGAAKEVPHHVIEAVRAAERNGRLAETLEAAVEESLTTRPFRLILGRTLLYPVALGGIALFVTTCILPQFGSIFSQIVDRDGRPLELPLVTRLALRISDFVLNDGIPLGAVLLLLAAPFAFRRVRHRFRWALDPLSFRVPLLARYRLLHVAERTCRTLAGYVRAGVTLEEALPQAGAATGSLTVQGSVDEAVAALRSGTPADRALQSLLLPPFVRARVSAATGGTPERFSAALEGLARECQWRRLRLGELLAASSYPVSLVLGTVITMLLCFGTFLPIIELQRALIPW